MLKDSFPYRLLAEPGAVFAELADGRAGWSWPVGLYAASAAVSAASLMLLPPDFLAEVSGGAALKGGHGFAWYLAVGLPGGLLFDLFACACLCLFAPFLRTGRLAWRLAAVVLGVASYAFFFMLPSPALAWPKRLAVLLAAAGAARAGFARRKDLAPLLKAALALALLSIAAELCGAAAAAAASPDAYLAGQVVFALASLYYLGRAGALYFGTGTAKAAAAALAAMAAALAFFSSLGAVGLLSKDLAEALLLI